MEDKSPFIPQEAKFSALENLDDDAQAPEKKDKKKKSRLSEWLSKFLRPRVDEDTSPEADKKREKTWRVTEAFKNLFSRATGVETDELPEGDSPEPERSLAGERSLYFPLTTELLPKPVGEAQLSYDKPAETEYQASESATKDEIPLYDGSVEVPQDNSEADNPDNVTIEHKPDRISDQTKPISTIESTPLREQQVFTPHRHESQPRAEKEVVVERGGGGGAALLGFVAAETLSRSRDAKIRREAEVLKKQVDQLEKNQTFQSHELNEVRDKNREQVEALRERRLDSRSERETIINHNKREETLTQPTQARETVVFERAERDDVQQNESAKRQPEHRGSIAKVRTEAVPESRPHPKSEELVFDQIEQAAERDIPLESYYERRHEAKDVPTSPHVAPAMSDGGYLAGATNVPDRSDAVLSETKHALSPSSRSQANDLYVQAAKQGVFAGLIAIVSFLIIVFIWSLR